MTFMLSYNLINSWIYLLKYVCPIIIAIMFVVLPVHSTLTGYIACLPEGNSPKAITDGPTGDVLT